MAQGTAGAPPLLVRSTSSLARRLLLLALFWAFVLLTITGLVLATVNRAAVERGFDRRLGVYVKLLIADIASNVDEPQVAIGANLGEPLFELPNSGWYWQITRSDTGGREVRQSRSLLDIRLEPLGPHVVPTGPTRSREGYLEGPTGQNLRVVERTIELGEDGVFVVVVAGDANDIADAVSQFNMTLLITLLLVGVGMVVAAILQVRIGLNPLERLLRELTAIRTGSRDHLEGNFPHEVAPLAREVNALIDANREVVERARTHVGNLAHALKTPLSVLQNEAALRDDALALKVGEQTRMMREQVNHHLERARMAARVQTIVQVIDVVPALQALVRTMEKVHRDRDLVIDLNVPDGIGFRGERQDFEEMAGNLIDNACKWATGRVTVTMVAEPVESAADRAFFTLVVDDDGPGLTTAQREAVRQRGRRLDETKPGSGLGLSIVRELSGLYGGALSLEESPLGGLRTTVRLPTV